MRDTLSCLDQASGLRRMFAQRAAQWTVVLQPAPRADTGTEALAARARQMARLCGDTLVIDAARIQVAAALGLRLRYDLEHARAGDCPLDEACVAAEPGLWVLPAARALDAAWTQEAPAAELGELIARIGQGLGQVVLILPATRVGWLRHCPATRALRSALVPVVTARDAGTPVLSTVRIAASDAQIDTFHLLFSGMGEAAAGRLLSGVAAIAKRHFGATVLAAGPAAGGPTPPCGTAPAPLESVS